MDAPDDAGTRIIRRIEELLRSSTLPPEKVFNIMRAAHSNSDYDPLLELDRLQREQRITE